MSHGYGRLEEQGWEMGDVVVDVSPSVDGFMAGPGVSVERPFGAAGHRLHRWLGFEGASPTADDREAAERMFATAGAVLLGRRMFKVGIGQWGPDGAFGRPCFVVTSRAHEDVVRGPTTFAFVTSGIKSALKRPATPQGSRTSWWWGCTGRPGMPGRGVRRQIRLHVAPVLLGSGTPLFGGPLPDSVELEPKYAMTTALATHLTFRVR